MEMEARHPAPQGGRASNSEAGGHLLGARLLRHFPELVRELGGQPQVMLAESGLDEADCEREGAASYEQWMALVDRAARELGAADFGMRLALRQGGRGVYGRLGTLMAHARTFGEATTLAVVHNNAHSLAARVWKAATASGAHVFLGHDVLVGTLLGRCQAVEQLMLLGHLGAMVLTGGRARAREVHFRHGNLATLRSYRRYFGCEVRFCRTEDGIAFRAADMAFPIHDADAHARTEAIAHLRSTFRDVRPSVSARVRGIVMQWLSTNECTSERVARLLALHPRTMNRRLHDEGTSFQRIKDQVRCDYLAYYIGRTDVELQVISRRLGFAEQSALSHFSQQMLGSSPRDLRARALRESALARL